MHAYRSHKCGDLRETDQGAGTRLSGWVHRVRDHGGLLFIDLRDHYGLTQIVADPDSPAFKVAETLRSEWVIKVDGKVRLRPAGTENRDLPTGLIEVFATGIDVLSEAKELPLPVFGDVEYPEDIRLKYRFLDLRRERVHENIMLRSNVIASIRRRMIAGSFVSLTIFKVETWGLWNFRSWTNSLKSSRRDGLGLPAIRDRCPEARTATSCHVSPSHSRVAFRHVLFHGSWTMAFQSAGSIVSL